MTIPFQNTFSYYQRAFSQHRLSDRHVVFVDNKAVGVVYSPWRGREERLFLCHTYQSGDPTVQESINSSIMAANSDHKCADAACSGAHKQITIFDAAKSG